MPRKVFSREEWGALPPVRTTPADGKVSRVIYTYMTRSKPCKKKEDCFAVMQKLQRSHLRRGMADIAYNFLVGGEGNIYEGRGWGVLPSATLWHTYGDRVDIAYIGEHTKMTLPGNMFQSGLELIHMGTRAGYIVREWDIIDIIYTRRNKKR